MVHFDLENRAEAGLAMWQGSRAAEEVAERFRAPTFDVTSPK